MKNKQRQFGLLALFVLTTAVAAALAVFRLPIDRNSKYHLVALICIAFSYWANRKYREQRRAAISFRDYFCMSAATLAALVFVAVEHFWHYELASNPLHRRIVLGVGVVILVIAQWFSITRIWKLYFAPSPPDPPKKNP